MNDVEGAKKWMDRQIRFLTFGSEVGWLISSYQKGLREIWAYQKKEGGSQE